MYRNPSKTGRTLEEPGVEPELGLGERMPPEVSPACPGGFRAVAWGAKGPGMMRPVCGGSEGLCGRALLSSAAKLPRDPGSVGGTCLLGSAPWVCLFVFQLSHPPVNSLLDIAILPAWQSWWQNSRAELHGCPPNSVYNM